MKWVRTIHVQTIDGEPLEGMTVELVGQSLAVTDAKGNAKLPMEDGVAYDFKVRDPYTPRHYGPGYGSEPGDYWYHEYAKLLPANERHEVPGAPGIYGMKPRPTMYPTVILMKRYVCDATTLYVATNSTAIVSTCRETTCGCAMPGENFPFSDDTFAMVSRIAPLVRLYAEKHQVPAVAIAGSIADEYNTRTGAKAFLDWVQDDVVINWLPNFAIELDVYLGFRSRLLNATRNDLGIGNINLGTAKRLQEAYPDTFRKNGMNYADLVQYIRSDEGTVHLATLAIRRGMELLDPYLGGFSPEKKESVYITYYKQGPSYLDKFLRRKALNASATPRPGEGCRVCLQRERFLKVLTP